MDKVTFGKSPAAIKLAEILDEIGDKKLTSRVTKILVNYNKISNEVKKAKGLTDETKGFINNAILANAKSNAKKRLTGKVLSFVLNLIIAENRMFVRKAMSLSLIKRRAISKQAILDSQKQLSINKQNNESI